MLVRPTSILRGVVFPGAVLALLSLSCANRPPSGGPGTYRGVLVNSIATGSIDVTVGEASRGPFLPAGPLSWWHNRIPVRHAGPVQCHAFTFVNRRLPVDRRLPTGVRLRSFTSSQDRGSFAMLPEDANSPVRLLCGTFFWTAPANSSRAHSRSRPRHREPLCASVPASSGFGNLNGYDALACEGSATPWSWGTSISTRGNHWGTGEGLRLLDACTLWRRRG